MNARTRIAFGVMLLALGAGVANLVLATLGSRLAQGRLFAMLCVLVVMVAGTMAAFGCIRVMKMTPAVWRVDAALPEEMSRERRQSLGAAVTNGALIAGLVIMFAWPGSMLTLVLLSQARMWGALRVRGSETVGTITGRHEYPGRYTPHDYLEYEFRHGILTIPDSARVSHTRWTSTAVGDATPVTYLPSAPSLSLPVARQAMSLLDVFPIELVVLLIVVVSLLICCVVLARLVQVGQLKFLRDGEPAMGRVTAIDAMRVRFTFDTPNGAVQSQFLDRSVALQRPAVGDTFALLYDPRKPARTWPWFRVRAWSGLAAADAPKASAGIVAREVLRQPVAESAGPVRVRLTWQAPFILIVMLAMSGPTMLRLGDSLSIHRRLARLQSSGVETNGVVIHTFAMHEPTAAMRVRYRYNVGPRTYESRFVAMSTRLQRRLGEGAATIVTYASDDPAVSLPLPKSELASDGDLASDVGFELPASIVFLSFVAMLAIWLIAFVAREWRLARRSPFREEAG